MKKALKKKKTQEDQNPLLLGAIRNFTIVGTNRLLILI